MDPFRSPKSPMVDIPMCDSDEEVYFGPVTSKELHKASQLKRKTQFYFPSFNFELRRSPVVKQNVYQKDDKGNSPKADVSSKPEQTELSLSADSLDGQNFFTLSDKPEDSSKGDYSTAHSETQSQTSLNDALLYSHDSDKGINQDEAKRYLDKSEDSLEVNSLPVVNGSSIYSNITDDSLENKPGQSHNNARSPSEISRDLSGMSSEPSLAGLKVKAASSISSDDACATTYDVLPEIERNETFSVDNGLYGRVDNVPSKVNMDLPEEVSIDKDGGFLSILSEAALYHASQLKGNENVLSPSSKNESVSTTQSLEDRFKIFGIDSGDLEGQQLTTSIMHTTGRESNALSTSCSFYTVTSSPVGSSNNMLNNSDFFNKLDVLQHLSPQPYECAPLINSGKITDTQSNQLVQDGTVDSDNYASRYSIPKGDSSHESFVDILDENQTVVLDQSSQDTQESSDVSGVCELNVASESGSDDSIQICNDEKSNDDSSSSSCVGELNDTLEEYEMMMRYGVDYIMGCKGNKKRGDNASCNSSFNSEMNSSGMGGNNLKIASQGSSEPQVQPKIASPVAVKQTSSCSSKLQDAVCAFSDFQTPGKTKCDDFTNHKVMSPSLKQSPRNTPQKSASKDIIHKTHASGPSKLPRVASKTPSKILHTPFPSPQSNKQCCGPLTPSGTKSGLFKRPITPVVSASRIPKTFASSQKSNPKVLEKIQSPVGAYIHNSPSPVLVTNVKAKMSDKDPFEKETHARALWRAGELKSFIPKPGFSQVSNIENINPNVGCGLPSVKYTRAPCIKLDETSKQPISRVGEKINKLLDSPSPQVIKHEGRLRVNCGSPQLAAKMHTMSDTMDDSLVDVHSVSGDISVCVSKQASRTDTLGH